MKGTRIKLAATVVGIVALVVGCTPRPVSNERDPADATIDRAVAAGADIPAHRRNLVARVLRLNEKDLIAGLRVFAELSGGRYPSRLDTKTTLKEADELGPSPIHMSQREKKQKIQDVFFASAFYERLKKEGRDVVYHGHTVTEGESRRILIRWSEPPDRHRVVFGDLSTRTVSARELTTLER